MFGGSSLVLPRSRRARRLAASVTAVAALGAVAAPAAQADVTSVGGGAYGESVNVTGLGLVPVTSGPLPSVTLPAGGGGPFTSSAAGAAAPASGSVLTTGLLQVSTEGGLGPAGFSESSAAVNNTNIMNGRITASVVKSSCRLTGDSATGSTTLLTAQADGTTLPVNPPPNTVINLPGLQVILNEQITSGGPGDYSMTVNAIHVRVLPPLGSGDIIISQSRCRVIGPNVVIPVAPIGIIGVTAALGTGFALLQRRRRNRDGSDGPAVTTT